MSMRFKGGIISATPPTTTAYTASGAWTLQQQMQAQGSGLWPAAGGYNLFTWGRNTFGQLSQNDTVDRSSPVQVGGKTWSFVASGSTHTLGIKNNGSLWAWGRNNGGQLGQNDKISRSSPVQIGVLTNWAKVVGGYYVTNAIKTDGTLWVWGSGSYGALGLGNTTSYSSPVQVGADTNWLNVACGGRFSIAVKTNGTLWSWGYNSAGCLGQNSTAHISSPTQIGSLTTWTDVAAGGWIGVGNGCGIKGGQIWMWGYGNYGTLGQGNLISRSSPVQVGALTTWNFVSIGRGHTLALRNDNTLWAWGSNGNGQLGINNSYNKSSPNQVAGSWISVSATMFKSNGIKSNGTLWSWGRNVYGALGLNKSYATVAQYSSPKQIGSLTTWTRLPKFSFMSYSAAASTDN